MFNVLFKYCQNIYAYMYDIGVTDWITILLLYNPYINIHKFAIHIISLNLNLKCNTYNLRLLILNIQQFLILLFQYLFYNFVKCKLYL